MCFVNEFSKAIVRLVSERKSPNIMVAFSSNLRRLRRIFVLLGALQVAIESPKGY